MVCRTPLWPVGSALRGRPLQFLENIMIKICTKCKTEYPATLEYFYKHPAGKHSLRPECKKCCKKYWQTEKGKEICRRASKNYRQTFNGCLRRRYYGINRRCNDLKIHNYKDYGGRGIKNKFKNFDDFYRHITQDLGIVNLKQIRGLQIDRIDNDGHYEPGNIRFVTVKENNNNKCRRDSK